MYDERGRVYMNIMNNENIVCIEKKEHLRMKDNSYQKGLQNSHVFFYIFIWSEERA